MSITLNDRELQQVLRLVAKAENAIRLLREHRIPGDSMSQLEFSIDNLKAFFASSDHQQPEDKPENLYYYWE